MAIHGYAKLKAAIYKTENLYLAFSRTHMKLFTQFWPDITVDDKFAAMVCANVKTKIKNIGITCGLSCTKFSRLSK